MQNKNKKFIALTKLISSNSDASNTCSWHFKNKVLLSLSSAKQTHHISQLTKVNHFVKILLKLSQFYNTNKNLTELELE